MLHDHKQARDRVEAYLKNCLEPARFEKLCDLDVEVLQCDEPCSYSEAAAADYTPVTLGFAWGPLWSTAWFRMSGRLIRNAAPEDLFAHIDTNTEACLWLDAVPYHGLSRFHKHVRLGPRFTRDGYVELMVEAAANQMWGVHHFKPEYPDQPLGLLKAAALLRIRSVVDALYHDMNFALRLADDLDHSHPRRRTLIYALNAAVNVIDPRRIAETAARACDVLRPALTARANASAAHCHAVGHAHIDTAWLWPIRETRRKCYRTFSTVLRLMDCHPDFRFQQGQALQYAFIQEDHPELFDTIRRRVAEGRWDAGGGVWVEPDCNLISGESIVRQIIHGVRYLHGEFGIEQTYLWLPDTFGYGASLPQILRQSGLDTFFTQKMSWSQFNNFPHHTFWWVGLDGSRVLSHFLTSDTYNSDCTPKQLRCSERAFRQSDRCNSWLYAFGWGDGGGGPTTEMLETLDRSVDCEEMPRVRQTTIRQFAEVLHADAENLPAWDGELYLEYHRGTLTTHAANKKANRLGELRLRDIEILHALSPNGLDDYPAAKLDSCWKTLLLNQFHDILPGSSIGWVYEDSTRDYARMDVELAALESNGIAAWLSAADTSAAKSPIVAINTLGWPRTEVVELPANAPNTRGVVAADGGSSLLPAQAGVDAAGASVQLAAISEVGSVGYRVFDLAGGGGRPEVASLPYEPARATDRSLENQWIRIGFDQIGRMVSLFDKRVSRELLPGGEKANQFVLYEDRPNSHDAWDIDVFYLEKPHVFEDRAKLGLIENGPLRAAIRIDRPIGSHSQLSQYIRLTCCSPRIDFETYVHWHGDHELLRVLFPTILRSEFASYDTQFGYLRRPTHFNTSWDLAKFECCGHHWCDLSEPNYGIALMSDCKYGYSCHGNVLGLSLLRAPTYPDPQADRGEHRFTYSLLPHMGDLCRGGVVPAGYELNVPLRVAMSDRHQGPRGARYSAMQCTPANVVIDTIKKAEASGRLVVRLYEAHGQHGTTTLSWEPHLGRAEPVDLLERPSPTILSATRSEPGRIEWPHRPFGLYTIAIG